MPIYKSLIVAPRVPDLPYAEQEAAIVVSALGGTLINGFVTLNTLIPEMQKGWDIIWFISHGNDSGIALSNGYATVSQLIQGVRASNAKLIVLNTCTSYKVAARMHSELRTYLICTFKDVLDQDAFITGRILAKELGEGSTFPSAFNAAIPGSNEDYAYFPGREERVIVSPPPSASDYPRDIRDEQSREKLEEIVARLEAVVIGSPRWPFVSLTESNKQMIARAETLETNVRKLEVELTRFLGIFSIMRRWLVGITITVVGIVFTVAALIISQWAN